VNRDAKRQLEQVRIRLSTDLRRAYEDWCRRVPLMEDPVAAARDADLASVWQIELWGLWLRELPPGLWRPAPAGRRIVEPCWMPRRADIRLDLVCGMKGASGDVLHLQLERLGPRTLEVHGARCRHLVESDWSHQPASLSVEEAEAGAPCLGCGRPLSGQADVAADEAFRVQHASCHAASWRSGSGPLHCDRCCPPPPPPDHVLAEVSRILGQLLERQAGQAEEWYGLAHPSGVTEANKRVEHERRVALDAEVEALRRRARRLGFELVQGEDPAQAP
jgi:hypothetical protein